MPLHYFSLLCLQAIIVLYRWVWWGMLLSSSLLVKYSQGQSGLSLLLLLYQTLTEQYQYHSKRPSSTVLT